MSICKKLCFMKKLKGSKNKKELKNAKKQEKAEKTFNKKQEKAAKKFNKKQARLQKVSNQVKEKKKQRPENKVQNIPVIKKESHVEWELPSPNVMPLTIYEKLEMERAKHCPRGPCDRVENIRLPPIDSYGNQTNSPLCKQLTDCCLDDQPRCLPRLQQPACELNEPLEPCNRIIHTESIIPELGFDMPCRPVPYTDNYCKQQRPIVIDSSCDSNYVPFRPRRVQSYRTRSYAQPRIGDCTSYKTKSVRFC